jgi:hypothetical protein
MAQGGGRHPAPVALALKDQYFILVKGEFGKEGLQT